MSNATTELEKAQAEKAELKHVKCVVWDLDHTVWDGILLEDKEVKLRPIVAEILETLDQRGILNSISSKNAHEPAWAKLEELGIDHYFLYPQINWNSKSSSVQQIAKSINIGLDTFVFVDDNEFEREEVEYALPEVMVVDSHDLSNFLDHDRLSPRFITPESRLRRSMYQGDISRKEAETDFVGATDEFLSTLEMRFNIRVPQQEDLQRAEELTMRTNQLNTTGYTYSYDELDALRFSPDHLLYVASLDDKYGTYGTIGLALVEKGAEVWTLKLLLMSCRVMSRGVGTIMMNYILGQAAEAGVKVQAEFVDNGRNRMMYVTYKFGGFAEVEKDGDRSIFEHDGSDVPAFPEYVEVELPELTA